MGPFCEYGLLILKNSYSAITTTPLFALINQHMHLLDVLGYWDVLRLGVLNVTKCLCECIQTVSCAPANNTNYHPWPQAHEPRIATNAALQFLEPQCYSSLLKWGQWLQTAWLAVFWGKYSPLLRHNGYTCGCSKADAPKFLHIGKEFLPGLRVCLSQSKCDMPGF